MSNSNKPNAKPSVRPKVRLNQNIEASPVYEPLDKKMINFRDLCGKQRSICFISREFCPQLNCITYYEPSFEEFNQLSQITLYNWLNDCRKFENMLLKIVDFPYFRFWSMMAYNHNMINSLNSYLCQATRPYRLHPMLKNADIKPVLSSIHRLVFKIIARLLHNKETERNHLSEIYYSELLKSIVNIPMILNLVQLYGYGFYSVMLQHLIKLIMTKYGDQFKRDLQLLCNELKNILLTELDHLTLSTDCSSNELCRLSCNISDLLFGLNKLALLFPELSIIYSHSDLIEPLIRFYSKYFPFIEQKCNDLFSNQLIVENLFKFLESQTKLSQVSLLLLFRQLLHKVYIHAILELQSDDQLSFDSLVNTLNIITAHKRFFLDYFTCFPFDKEFELLLNNHKLNQQLLISDVLAYYKDALRQTIADHNAQKSSAKVNTAINTTLLNSLATFSLEPSSSKLSNKHSTINNTGAQQEQIEEKVMSIREVFPDLGDGFVYKCLEYYNFDYTKVIEAILECDLPPQLESIDRKLSKSDLVSIESSAEQKKSLKHDSTSMKDMQLAQIYIGKKDKFEGFASIKEANKEKTIQLAANIVKEEEEASLNAQMLLERGKVTKQELKTNIDYLGIDLYDDEFDDTYENEDISFDVQGETFDDKEDNDKFVQVVQQEHEQVSQTGDESSRPAVFDREKFDNQSCYLKKQSFHKRDFNRKQNQKSSQVNESNVPLSSNSVNMARKNVPPFNHTNHQANQATSVGKNQVNHKSTTSVTTTTTKDNRNIHRPSGQNNSERGHQSGRNILNNRNMSSQHSRTTNQSRTNRR